MFHSIVNKFDKENNSSTPERVSNCDLILGEMTEIASRDLALRYESDKNIVYCSEKTEGEILVNLVLLKAVFSNKALPANAPKSNAVTIRMAISSLF